MFTPTTHHNIVPKGKKPTLIPDSGLKSLYMDEVVQSRSTGIIGLAQGKVHTDQPLIMLHIGAFGQVVDRVYLKPDDILQGSEIDFSRSTGQQIAHCANSLLGSVFQCIGTDHRYLLIQIGGASYQLPSFDARLLDLYTFHVFSKEDAFRTLRASGLFNVTPEVVTLSDAV